MEQRLHDYVADTCTFVPPPPPGGGGAGQAAQGAAVGLPTRLADQGRATGPRRSDWPHADVTAAAPHAWQHPVRLSEHFWVPHPHSHFLSLGMPLAFPSTSTCLIVCYCVLPIAMLHTVPQGATWQHLLHVSEHSGFPHSHSHCAIGPERAGPCTGLPAPAAFPSGPSRAALLSHRAARAFTHAARGPGPRQRHIPVRQGAGPAPYPAPLTLSC